MLVTLYFVDTVHRILVDFAQQDDSEDDMEDASVFESDKTLPAHARTIHDGLYRAIDVYLKAHQGLSDPDKKRLCNLIDFQKLSQEAGAHAAQNERLPLQSIVQVLYFEQLRLRNSLSCSYPDDDHKPMHQSWRISSGALSAAMSPRDNYASLRRERTGS
ncbi:unnamed protein product [Ilex paraguariensis]|uniref:NPH3 domain-containing protein n=1 Tax=Ilex paraguariensis TaxID=185542 RepID=A0ABC8TCB9_9AQUA